MIKQKNQPAHNSEQVMAELMDTVVSAYNVEFGTSLQTIADELGLNPIKVRKILITAGVYESEIADKVLYLYKEGKTVEDIMLATGLSKSSVNSYLPYTKVTYKTKEISATAERIRLYRARKVAVDKLQEDIDAEKLWECMKVFAGYPFRTTKGLKFTYQIKGNEMFVDRKEKSITKATVELAFMKAVAQEGNVLGPKRLGCFGASYLYPVFVRFGIIKVRADDLPDMV